MTKEPLEPLEEEPDQKVDERYPDDDSSAEEPADDPDTAKTAVLPPPNR